MALTSSLAGRNLGMLLLNEVMIGGKGGFWLSGSWRRFRSNLKLLYFAFAVNNQGRTRLRGSFTRSTTGATKSSFDSQ